MDATVITATGTVVAACIALIGVILTAVVAFTTTIITLRSKIREVRYGVLSVCADHLCKARLLAYSDLYYTLSNAIKHIDYPDLMVEDIDIKHLAMLIMEWDSKNGVLYSKESGSRAMEVLVTLDTLCKKYSSIGECLHNPNTKKQIEDAIVGLEVALRSDLGVYAVEYWNIKRNFLSFAGRERVSYESEPFLGRNAVIHT